MSTELTYVEVPVPVDPFESALFDSECNLLFAKDPTTGLVELLEVC